MGTHRLRHGLAAALTLVAVGAVGACSSTPPPETTFTAVAATYPNLPGDAPDGQPYVEMPHLALRVDSLDVRTEIAAHHAAALDMASEDVAAEEGHEFVVAVVSAFPGSYGEGEPVTTIEAAGESHDITAVADEASGTSGGSVAVFVDVLEGEPVTLSIADEGRTVTLDLRTGRPAVDAETTAITALYQRRPPELSGELESTAVVTPIDDNVAIVMPPSEIWISATASPASVRWLAWLGGGPGWAPEGEGFVAISGLAFFSQLTGSGCVAGWSPVHSVTLTPEGGEPIAPVGSSDIDTMVELEGQLFFQVPTDVTSASLTLDPQTSVSDECELAEPFEAVGIPIDLG